MRKSLKLRPTQTASTIRPRRGRGLLPQTEFAGVERNPRKRLMEMNPLRQERRKDANHAITIGRPTRMRSFRSSRSGAEPQQHRIQFIYKPLATHIRQG